MRKSTEQTPQKAEKQSPKSRGRKTAQAIAFAVLTVLWAEQATSPQIAQAGLAHAQQETAKETQRVQERKQLVVRMGEILQTVINIYKVLIPIDPQSTQAKKLLTQMYQLQTEYISICASLKSDTESDKKFVAWIDETFKKAKFKPLENWPKVYVCDANWCKL